MEVPNNNDHHIPPSTSTTTTQLNEQLDILLHEASQAYQQRSVAEAPLVQLDTALRDLSRATTTIFPTSSSSSSLGGNNNAAVHCHIRPMLQNLLLPPYTHGIHIEFQHNTSSTQFPAGCVLVVLTEFDNNNTTVSSECHPVPQFTRWSGSTCRYTSRPSQVTFFLVHTTTTTTISSSSAAAVLLHQVKLDPLFFLYREEGALSSLSSTSSSKPGGRLVIPRDVNLSFTTTTMTLRVALPKVVFGIYPCPGVVLEKYILGQKMSSLPLDFNSNNNSGGGIDSGIAGSASSSSSSSASLLNHHRHKQHQEGHQYVVRGQLDTKGEYVQLTVQAVTNGGSSLRSAASPCALLEITLSASSVPALLKLHSSIIERIKVLPQQVGSEMMALNSSGGGGRGGGGGGRGKDKVRELDAAQLLYSPSSSHYYYYNNNIIGDVVGLETMLDEVKKLQTRILSVPSTGDDGGGRMEMMRLRKVLSKIPLAIHV